MLGARIGKYGPDGKPRALAAHSIPMAVLGTFILLFGWFGFNAASTFAATDVRFTVVATNTAIAGAFGAVVAMFYVMRRMGKPDPGMMVNGMLAGLVAITAPCAFVQPWAAAVIGAIAAVIVVEAIFFIERKGIDDPVGAISVHGVGGIVRRALRRASSPTAATAPGGTSPTARRPHGKGVTGILYGNGEFLGSGSFGKLGFGQLASQVIGALVIIFVMGGFAYAFFKIQNALMKGGIRSDRGRRDRRSRPCRRWVCSPTTTCRSARSTSSASRRTSSCRVGPRRIPPSGGNHTRDARERPAGTMPAGRPRVSGRS